MLYVLILSSLFIISKSELTCPYPPVTDCTDATADTTLVCQWNDATATLTQLGTLCTVCNEYGQKLPDQVGVCCDPQKTQCLNDWSCDQYTSTQGVCRCPNCGLGKDCAKTTEVCSQTAACGTCSSITSEPTDKPTPQPTDKPTPKPTDKPTAGPTITLTVDCSTVSEPCDLSSSATQCGNYGIPEVSVSCKDDDNGCGQCQCTECYVETNVGCATGKQCVASKINYPHCGSCQAVTPEPTKTNVDCAQPCDPSVTAPCATYGNANFVECQQSSVYPSCYNCNCLYCNTEYDTCGANRECTPKFDGQICGNCQLQPTPEPSQAPTYTQCSGIAEPCDLSSNDIQCANYGVPDVSVVCKDLGNGCGQCQCTECYVGTDSACDTSIGEECVASKLNYPHCGSCQVPVTPQPTTQQIYCGALARHCDKSSTTSCPDGFVCEQRQVSISGATKLCYVCACPDGECDAYSTTAAYDCGSTSATCDTSTLIRTVTFSDNTVLKCGTCSDAPTQEPVISPTDATCAGLNVDASLLCTSDTACGDNAQCVFASSDTLKKCGQCECKECDKTSTIDACSEADSTSTCDRSSNSGTGVMGYRCGTCSVMPTVELTAKPTNTPTPKPTVKVSLTSEPTKDGSVDTTISTKYEATKETKYTTTSGETDETEEPATSDTTSATEGTETTEEDSCNDDEEDGTCFDTVSSDICKKTIRAKVRASSYSNTDTTLGSSTQTLCELCAKVAGSTSDNPVCECLALVKETLEDDIKTRLSDWLQARLLEYCWDSDDCSAIADVEVKGDTCECAALMCNEVVGQTEEEREGDDPGVFNMASVYPIGVAVCIGFVFYAIQ